MWRKLLNISGFLVLVAFIIVTLAFTSGETKDVVCSEVEIKYVDNELIKLNKNEITRLVMSADKNLIGKNLQKINADFIEKEVEKNQAVLKAEVYKVMAKDSLTYTGILGVKVKHREPAVRIMSLSGNYYLDKDGIRIPVSSNYTADVLVATGYFSEDFAREQLLPFVLYLKHDAFWNAQTEQVHVDEDGNVLLTPLVGNHLVELGNFENFPEKLRNMKAFYKQVLTNNNWNKYEKVSLKYKNQIIAKRR